MTQHDLFHTIFCSVSIACYCCSGCKLPYRILKKKTKSTPNASWTLEDKKKLVDFLLDNSASAEDNGNFTSTIYQAVSNMLNPLVISASITPECASVWDDWIWNYLKKKIAKQFQNKGWIYYRSLKPIMPKYFSDVNMFHPSAFQATNSALDALQELFDGDFYLQSV